MNKPYTTKKAVKQEFAKYGFTQPPLTDSQIELLIQAGHDKNTIYGVGCDVSAFGNGYPIKESLQAFKDES